MVMFIHVLNENYTGYSVNCRIVRANSILTFSISEPRKSLRVNCLVLFMMY